MAERNDVRRDLTFSSAAPRTRGREALERNPEERGEWGDRTVVYLHTDSAGKLNASLVVGGQVHDTLLPDPNSTTSMRTRAENRWPGVDIKSTRTLPNSPAKHTQGRRARTEATDEPKRQDD